MVKVMCWSAEFRFSWKAVTVMVLNNVCGTPVYLLADSIFENKLIFR